jgi:hypothetical protein
MVMKKHSSSMGRKGLAFCVLVAGLGLANGGSAQEVSVDYDRQADFSRCRTYAWAAGRPAESTLVDKRIVQAVDEALAAKGLRKGEGGPGCYVMYHASVKEQHGLAAWGTGGRFLGGMATVDVTTVKNGMLVVDIGDAATRQLIWRGVAKDTLSDKPEKNQKKLRKCMDKMFKDFPSGPANS